MDLIRKYLDAPYEDIPEQVLDLARATGRKVVAIGGGTGLSTLLLGLKEYTENITAIVTVTDDGGGSGVLRREFGILPPGDIRNCILALADSSSQLRELLNYRFDGGSLQGQSFGNLFLLALNNVSGSFAQAVADMSRILAITGRVLPVCDSNVALQATFADGSVVRGETSITAAKKERDLDIRSVSLDPVCATALPQALEAIEEAELIVLGPGSLYTSVIPNLLVEGICEAIAESDAVRVYVLNVMTQDGETENYTASDHIRALMKHAKVRNLFDLCLANNYVFPEEIVLRYREEGASPMTVDQYEIAGLGVQTIFAAVADDSSGMARHNPDLLAAELINIFRNRTRTRIYR